VNSKLCKQIRKHVQRTYPFMSEESLYSKNIFGVIRLHQLCQRAFVQNIKRNYNKGVSNG